MDACIGEGVDNRLMQAAGRGEVAFGLSVYSPAGEGKDTNEEERGSQLLKKPSFNVVVQAICGDVEERACEHYTDNDHQYPHERPAEEVTVVEPEQIPVGELRIDLYHQSLF